MSIRKRAAVIGATAVMIAVAGPAAAQAQVGAPPPSGPVAGAYQAGAVAAIGGFNAGTAAAVGGWNAGAAALGMPFQFTVNAGGPFGLYTAGIAPIQ